jgi:hypothetical protein
MTVFQQGISLTKLRDIQDRYKDMMPQVDSGITQILEFKEGVLYFENSAGNTLTGSRAVALNTWAHVACVRSSGTVTLYINGVNAGSGAAAGSISSTVAVSIGNALSGGTFGNFNGYISNARITKGGALYTSVFTPTTTPLTTTAL